MPDINGIVEQSSGLSVASEQDANNRSGINYLFLSLANSGSIISPWWSTMRDVDIRRFWKSVDHLSGTIYSMEAKLTSIPFKILAKDQSNRQHIKQANETTDVLVYASQIGEGWNSFFGKILEDYLSQDNGFFTEIIGDGDPAGPIIGGPLTLNHLDASRCTRTGNRTFPVVYRDDNGKSYKLHYTRVMFQSSMPSPIREMYGVGFCSVSRCLNVAQTILDVMTYKMEKLGSRPSRGMMVTRGGLDPEDIRKAFLIAEHQMTNQNLTRYSKTVVVGDATLTEAGVDLIDLSKLPDGFDEETSMYLAIGAIALGFGIDVREIFPMINSGSTRADALLQHIKQRGKSPGQIITLIESLINYKFLPPHLYMSFDYQDDAQDRQVAETRKIRSDVRTNNLKSSSVDIRTAREQMEVDGDLTHEQLVMLELQDGRLSDGTSIMNLFYSDQKPFKTLLGIVDPFNATDIVSLGDAISTRAGEIRKMISNAPDGTVKNDYITAFYALMNLAKHYGMTGSFPELEKNKPEQPPGRSNDPRIRNVDQTNPVQADVNVTQDNMNQDWNDTPSAGVARSGKKKEYEKARGLGPEAYAYDIRNCIRAFWSGEWDWFDFYSNMMQAIEAGLTHAYYKGAEEVGVDPETLTPEERFALKNEIQRNFMYLEGFADTIDKNLKAKGGKLTSLLERGKLWSNRYNQVMQIAKQNANNDPRLEWVFGDTIKHCDDCLRLNGKVFRASVWKASGIQPGIDRLACGGFKCRCTLRETEKALTPGVPPALVGQGRKK